MAECETGSRKVMEAQVIGVLLPGSVRWQRGSFRGLFFVDLGLDDE